MHHCPSNAIYSAFEEGTEGELSVRRWMRFWFPALTDYQPQLILVSAGFDAHREEDQAQLLMIEKDYAFLGRRFGERDGNTA